MAYFFDSYAIIELLNNNENYAQVAHETIITNALHLGEVHYYLLRSYGKETAESLLRKLKVQLLEITLQIALEASLFRYEHKKLELSYADCIGYVTALRYSMKFLTGDKAFEKLRDVEFIR